MLKTENLRQIFLNIFANRKNQLQINERICREKLIRYVSGTFYYIIAMNNTKSSDITNHDTKTLLLPATANWFNIASTCRSHELFK